MNTRCAADRQGCRAGILSCGIVATHFFQMGCDGGLSIPPFAYLNAYPANAIELVTHALFNFIYLTPPWPHGSGEGRVRAHPKERFTLKIGQGSFAALSHG